MLLFRKVRAREKREVFRENSCDKNFSKTIHKIGEQVQHEIVNNMFDSTMENSGSLVLVGGDEELC